MTLDIFCLLLVVFKVELEICILLHKWIDESRSTCASWRSHKIRCNARPQVELHFVLVNAQVIGTNGRVLVPAGQSARLERVAKDVYLERLTVLPAGRLRK